MPHQVCAVLLEQAGSAGRDEPLYVIEVRGDKEAGRGRTQRFLMTNTISPQAHWISLASKLTSTVVARGSEDTPSP